MVAGELAIRYRIVDRGLGAQAELIPDLFGMTMKLPTGTRGLGRGTGGPVPGLVVLHVLRYLEASERAARPGRVLFPGSGSTVLLTSGV